MAIIAVSYALIVYNFGFNMLFYPMTVLQEIEDFLPCNTPQLWVDNALVNPELLLIDHANCEKKRRVQP